MFFFLELFSGDRMKKVAEIGVVVGGGVRVSAVHHRSIYLPDKTL